MLYLLGIRTRKCNEFQVTRLRMLVANGFSVLLFLNHGNNTVPEMIIIVTSWGLDINYAMLIGLIFIGGSMDCLWQVSYQLNVFQIRNWSFGLMPLFTMYNVVHSTVDTKLLSESQNENHNSSFLRIIRSLKHEECLLYSC